MGVVTVHDDDERRDKAAGTKECEHRSILQWMTTLFKQLCKQTQ